MQALYDELSRTITPSLTTDSKRKLIDNIKLLPKESVDVLYMLIRYSSLIEGDITVYGAKYQRKGVVFDLDSFPEKLQSIIVTFVNKNINKGKSEIHEIVFD